MADFHSITDSTTVVPVLREDGTIYFRAVNKSAAVRAWEWGLASLWLLAGGVFFGALLI